MLAGHQELANLIAIYDANGMQGDDWVEKQLNHLPALDGLAAMGWEMQSIDGHDVQAIADALQRADSNAKPTFIHANTIKGKGVKMMENVLRWHGSVAMTDQELQLALQQLGD